jgi:lysophospholipase L1-like esterase
MAHIFIIGDSIAEGYFDTSGGWATRLQNQLAEERFEVAPSGAKIPLDFFRNMSMSGDTIYNAIKRIESEANYRIYDKTDLNIPILAMGINDSWITDYETAKDIASEKIPDGGADIQEPLVNISLQNFETAFHQMIEIIARVFNEENNHQTDIFILELTPCQSTVTDDGDDFHVEPRVVLFNNKIKELIGSINESRTYKNQLIFIPIRKAFEESQHSFDHMFKDGLHPWEDGHELIANEVFSYVLPYLAQTKL